jgi:HSP20 family protein
VREVHLAGPKDPLQELLNLQERINRLFEESLDRGGRDDDLAAFGSGAWAPLADVYETPDNFVVVLELPGVARDDMELGVADNILTVKGQRRMSGARPDSFSRMERSYGLFARSFRFTDSIDTDRMTADFRDGILKVQLPKLRPRSDWRSRATDK